MPETAELTALGESVYKVNVKILQALRIRSKILQRIRDSCEILKADPLDRNARDSLVTNLERERKFLGIIRRGSKEGIKALEKALKSLKRTQAPEDVKATTEALILNLIDSMRFSERKIKAIEKRVKQGERLEYKDYTNKHITKFLDTLKEEEELDTEITARLKGELNRIVPPFKALAEKLGISAVAGGMAGMGFGVMGSWIENAEFMVHMSHGMSRELANQATTPLGLIMMIIGGGIGFLYMFLYWDIKMAENEKKTREELSH